MKRRWRASVGGLTVLTMLSLGQGISDSHAARATPGPSAGDSAGWQAPEPIDPLTGNVMAVSCPSVSFCLAVDGVGNALTYDGVQWSDPAPVGVGHHPLTSLTCPSADFCAVLDDRGQVVMYNGESWSTPRIVAPGVILLSISCLSGTFCVAGGATTGTSLAIVWDGVSWSHQTTLDETPVAVSCATPTFCAAVDSRDGVVTFDGSTWSRRKDFGLTPLLSVSCPTPTFCAASGGRQVVTYDGSRWSASKFPQKFVLLASVSCASAGSCVVIDAAGRYATYHAGEWSALIRFVDQTVTGMDCATETFCIAVRRESEALVFDGSEWTSQGELEPGSPNGLQSISCATKTFCIAVDDAGSAFRYGRSGWSDPMRVADTSLLTVQCPSRTYCLTVSEQGGRVMTFDGSAWSRAADLPGGDSFPDVSCTSARFCLALEQSGSVYRFDGAAWSKVATLDPDESVLSCATPTFCVAGGRFHGVWIWDGISFTQDDSYPLDSMGAVSCTAAHFCMAIGGGWTAYDGSTWSAPVPPPQPGTKVSCASAQFCAAANTLAQARVFDGSDWSDATALLRRNAHDEYIGVDVSCASSAFCMAITATGYVVAYR